ncbi:MAG: ATP-dependent RNA helicase HrpA [bacterium]
MSGGERQGGAGDGVRLEFDPALPVCAERERIAAAIAGHQVVIVCGATGSGKTTQLPKICLGMGLGGSGRGRRGCIAHTQPRRVAARSVGARVAEELGGELGRRGVGGCKVRFSDETGPANLVQLMTDGVLLNELAQDGDLRTYHTIIIDEAHERSLNIDFLLGCLRRLLASGRRPDLKVVITSATIEPQRFSDFFGGAERAPVIMVGGRSYPVEVRYRPGEGEMPTAMDVVDAVDHLRRDPLGRTGDILVFLPGEREIREAAAAIERHSAFAGELEVLPLFAKLSTGEQDRIFRPGPRPRVVLATNVAETSLTIPRIYSVIDTGVARLNRYDHASRTQRLLVEPVSRASADQRLGRCGRLGPGVCVRLYDAESYASRPAFTAPEIQRTALASAILLAANIGIDDLSDFPLLDPPDGALVREGLLTLYELGAIATRAVEDGAGFEITEVGRRLSRLPLDVRVGRIVLAGAKEGCLDEAAVLAAALSIADPRERPSERASMADAAHGAFRDATSDFMTLLNIFDAVVSRASGDEGGGGAGGGGGGGLFSWCRERYLSASRVREWLETWRQIMGVCEEVGLMREPGARAKAGESVAIHRAVLSGLIAGVCGREEVVGRGPVEYRSIRGQRAVIFPGSVLFGRTPRWIVAADLWLTSRLYARTVAAIEPEWIETVAPQLLNRQLSDAHFDAEHAEGAQARVFERLTLGGFAVSADGRGIVAGSGGLPVAPRREIALAAAGPEGAKRARALLLEEGLAMCRWAPAGLEALVENRRRMERAAGMAARLRRPEVLAGAEVRVKRLEAVVPAEVCDGPGLERWVATGGAGPRGERLALPLESFLAPTVDGRGMEEILAGLGADYPSEVALVGPCAGQRVPLRYALEPGKAEDGVTVELGLEQLAGWPAGREQWLAPGMLPARVAAMIKGLAKPVRAGLEQAAGKAGLEGHAVAAALAEAVTFGQGRLGESLSEAAEVLLGVKVEAGAWPEAGLPEHLRMRMVVSDERGRTAYDGRDAGAMFKSLEGRIAQAARAAARKRFARQGVTGWDFGELPESVGGEEGMGGAGGPELYPAVVDRGESVELTLVSDRVRAAALSEHGVRRLVCLACKEELTHRITALGNWDEMTRQYQQIGPAGELADSVALLVCERVFLLGQPPVRNREQMEARLEEQWGRLGQATFEVAAAVAEFLEHRAFVAKRLSGGTPRMWINSIADIREQAAFLMPPGFLRHAGWRVAAQFPKYAKSMKTRLLNLREDGSGGETAALATVGPHWKRLTGWVARAAVAQRTETPDEAGAGGKGKAALPQGGSKKNVAVIAVDNALWAAQPGNLPPEVAAYRWAVEEFRVATFTPELVVAGGGGGGVTAKRLDELWSAVKPAS